ncbi:apolipoprotein C-IV [Sardina pilchardus]|uniref:apolipoprotein C-IV n=1 Tax=Sardina pilchardus TaxID=27697 RepID=UPI002E1248DC
MSKNLALLVLICMLPACTLMASTTPGPPTTGVIQRTKEAYRSAVENVKNVGEVVWNIGAMYYDDHLKERVDSYLTWPSFDYTSVWNRVKARVPWTA